MSEVLIEARTALQVKFSEIVISESREEPLTPGPCRLVVPISSKRLREPALTGSLTFLDVYIAKIFEVTIRNSTPGGECSSALGSSNKLTWSIFVGDSEGSKDGQRWYGNYNIPRKLACEKAEEYGLAAPESTLLNQHGVGTTQVDIPVLAIYGDEKIKKWKQFVKLFLANFSVGFNTEGITTSVDRTFQHPIDKELEKCLEKNPSTNGRFQCALKAYDQWDGELNRIYRELKSKLDAQDQEVLKSAQLKWIEYRDKEFALVDKIYPKDGSGTLTRNRNAFRQMNVVKARVLELIEYLQFDEPESSEVILNEGVFEGISEEGDFQEALADAIQKAKAQLKTTFVRWKLNEFFGENGGFVGINRLKVSITAIPSSEATEP